MAPKPRPVRRPSTASQALATAKPNAGKPTEQPAAKPPVPKAAATLMPPPPDPVPTYGILEGEVRALESILKNATLKAAQLYAFHVDSVRLGLGNYAPKPPRSLLESLGQEVEKYDQLCDMVDAQLQRSIAVLQRDIAREEAKLQAEERAIAPEARMKTPAASPIITRPSLPPIDIQTSPLAKDELHSVFASPTAMTMPSSISAGSSGQISPPTGAGSSFLARRQSVITQSSLHRPSSAMLPRLDLSSSSLRINPEELMRGLGSPVTLAPRSARTATADSLASDLFSAITASGDTSLPPAVDMGPGAIDLTLDASMPTASAIDLTTIPISDTIDLTLDAPLEGMEGGRTLGSSADQPIELDLDADLMPDVFGDVINTPSLTGSSVDHSIPLPSVFDPPGTQLPGKGGPSASDLLRTLTGNTSSDIMSSLNMAGSAPMDSLMVPPMGLQGGTPSPASLLSSLEQQQTTMPWDMNTFDFSQMPDLPDFASANEGDVSMDDVFGLAAPGPSTT